MLLPIAGRKGPPILKHIANGCVFDVKGLNPILERGCELPSGAAKLFEQIGAKFRVWLADIHRLNESFVVEEHWEVPWLRSRNG